MKDNSLLAYRRERALWRAYAAGVTASRPAESGMAMPKLQGIPPADPATEPLPAHRWTDQDVADMRDAMAWPATPSMRYASTKVKTEGRLLQEESQWRPMAVPVSADRWKFVSVGAGWLGRRQNRTRPDWSETLCGGILGFDPFLRYASRKIQRWAVAKHRKHSGALESIGAVFATVEDGKRRCDDLESLAIQHIWQTREQIVYCRGGLRRYLWPYYRQALDEWFRGYIRELLSKRDHNGFTAVNFTTESDPGPDDLRLPSIIERYNQNAGNTTRSFVPDDPDAEMAELGKKLARISRKRSPTGSY